MKTCKLWLILIGLGMSIGCNALMDVLDEYEASQFENGYGDSQFKIKLYEHFNNSAVVVNPYKGEGGKTIRVVKIKQYPVGKVFNFGSLIKDVSQLEFTITYAEQSTGLDIGTVADRIKVQDAGKVLVVVNDGDEELYVKINFGKVSLSANGGGSQVSEHDDFDSISQLDGWIVGEKSGKKLSLRVHNNLVYFEGDTVGYQAPLKVFADVRNADDSVIDGVRITAVELENNDGLWVEKAADGSFKIRGLNHYYWGVDLAGRKITLSITDQHGEHRLVCRFRNVMDIEDISNLTIAGKKLIIKQGEGFLANMAVMPYSYAPILSELWNDGTNGGSNSYLAKNLRLKLTDVGGIYGENLINKISGKYNNSVNVLDLAGKQFYAHFSAVGYTDLKLLVSIGAKKASTFRISPDLPYWLMVEKRNGNYVISNFYAGRYLDLRWLVVGSVGKLQFTEVPWWTEDGKLSIYANDRYYIKITDLGNSDTAAKTISFAIESGVRDQTPPWPR